MVLHVSRRRRFLAVVLASIAIGGRYSDTAVGQEVTQLGLEPVVVLTNMQEGQSTAEISNPNPTANPSELQLPSPVRPQSPDADNKKRKEAAMAKMNGAYAGVFYANDFSYLNDPSYSGPRYFSDNFKNLNMPWGTLDLGGESRYRYHSEKNMRGLGITGRDDDFLLTRTRLYADWQLSDDIRVFAEMLDANSSFENFNPRPIEENDFDALNLFVDMKWYDGANGRFTTRLGRQELLYGAQRTVSPLDWANTRRTFEGLRGLYEIGDTSIDAFWTTFVPVLPKELDYGDRDIQFYGTYATQKNTPLGTMEAYWLGFDDHNIGQSLQTVGSRVSGATKNGMLYDFEGAYQFGANETTSDHSAGFITAGIGRKIETNYLSPTVWFYYDWASGEEDFDQVQRADDGYDHLFPLAHKYNGFMDLFGRRNLHDINVFSLTPLSKKVSLILWYHYFRLDQATTPYSVVMTPYNTANAAESKDLGHEIDVLLNINLNPRNNLVVGYSHFQAGDYYRETTIPVAPGRSDLNGEFDANFFYLQYTTRY